MLRRFGMIILIVGGAALFGGLMYLAGWHAAATAAQAAPVSATPVQNLPMQPEMIPFPAPDRQGLGQGLGPGQDCQPMIQFYVQGWLYKLRPGADIPPWMPVCTPE